MPLSDLEIKERIKNFPRKEKFLFDSRSSKWYTYGEIWKIASCLAQRLHGKNYNTIVAVMDNGIDLFCLYFACMLGNMTIIPIDPRKSQKEIDTILKENRNMPVIDNKSEIFAPSDDSSSKDEDFSENIDAISLSKIYMITYTSGSTGHAKGVIHSLRNLFLAAESFGKATGLSSDHIMCHVMPMTYMAGILNTIIMPFFCGEKIILLPRFDVMSATKFWKNVELFNITAFWLSPTMLNILMTIDKKGRSKEYLSGKKTLFYIGTAPLFPNTREKFESKYGVKLLQSYGLSETLFISTEVPGREIDAKSVGNILPEAEISIGKNDEICIGVPWMFLGYSNENTEDYFENGKYKSGDMGQVDEEDRLFITGRIKDLIIKGGMNISPAQIEKVLNGLGQLEECAVVGVKVNDEENIACWYVPKHGVDFSTIHANEAIEMELGRHARIDYFLPLKTIPKNLNGKTDKQKLAREFTP